MLRASAWLQTQHKRVKPNAMKNPILPFAVLSAFVILAACNSPSADGGKAQTDTEIQEAAVLAHHQKLGDSLVTIAQAEMLSKVSQAMQEGGAPNAVDFCNIHAPGITTELAEKWNCTVRRTSTMVRNPDNQPDTNELKILRWYQSLGDGELTSTVWRDEGTIHYSSPIRIKLPACLKCHGVPGQDIDEATLAIIGTRYAEDKAINYKQGDLRGMWHLTFNP